MVKFSLPVPEVPVSLVVSYDRGFVWRIVSAATGRVLDGSQMPLPTILELIHAVSPYGYIPAAVIQSLDAAAQDGGHGKP